jgi:hypothetical protein
MPISERGCSRKGSAGVDDQNQARGRGMFTDLRRSLEAQQDLIAEQLAALTNLEAAFDRARTAFQGLPAERAKEVAASGSGSALLAPSTTGQQQPCEACAGGPVQPGRRVCSKACANRFNRNIVRSRGRALEPLPAYPERPFKSDLLEDDVTADCLEPPPLPWEAPGGQA